jgi:hypothetical protein
MHNLQDLVLNQETLGCIFCILKKALLAFADEATKPFAPPTIPGFILDTHLDHSRITHKHHTS